jgi:hypothetical protein
MYKKKGHYDPYHDESSVLYALYPIELNLLLHINEPPYFETELGTFKVFLNETAFVEEIETFVTYKSPLIMDLELDYPALEFFGVEIFPFVLIDVWEDHFTCTIDTSQISLSNIGIMKFNINMLDFGPDPRIYMDQEFVI